MNKIAIVSLVALALTIAVGLLWLVQLWEIVEFSVDLNIKITLTYGIVMILLLAGVGVLTMRKEENVKSKDNVDLIR